MSKVFQLICKKTWKNEPKTPMSTIYHRVQAFQRTHSILSKQLAQNAYAYVKMSISIQKLGLREEEIEELQNWLDKRTQPVSSEPKQERKETRALKISKKIVDVSDLPTNLVDEAKRMAGIYPDMYVLENLVRYVVMSVLESKYSSGWWNNREVVSGKIAEKVEERKHFERQNRWVAKRRTHEIFYTDLRDLSKIITTNSKDFKKIFADLEIEAELRKLEPSRNIIAHNNPLPLKEFDRIKMCFDDLKKQLKGFAEKERG